jgi:hypothetical protein
MNYSRQNNGFLPRNTDFWTNMGLLRFFSRVAFICNICYLLTSLERYGPPILENNDVISTIIVLGWLLSIGINLLVNLWALVAWSFRKGRLEVPRWLLIVNFIFLLAQLIIILFFMHDSRNS